MKDVKYPISDDMIDLSVKALEELALRLEIAAAALVIAEAHSGALRSAQLLDRAAKLREASDYFLSL